MSTTTTVTVTEIRPEGDERTVFARDYTTLGGARRGLAAAIARETMAWGHADEVSWQVAEREAGRWDGVTAYRETVSDWARRGCLALRFEAC